MPQEIYQTAYLWIAWVPALAALVVYVLGGLGRQLPRAVAVLASAVMVVLAATVLFQPDTRTDVNAGPWVSYGLFQLSLAFHLDAFRVLLLAGVSLFSLLISLYSVRAADGLPKERRYWAFLLWAVAGAAVVVTADNLWLLLIGWEVVTLMLYLLANYGQAEARKGAFKTFVMLGFSDGALLLGILLLLVGRTGADAAVRLQDISGVATDRSSTVVCYALLLVAALAKAGAMPLHTWIPAMAEKTPAAVFALLPAALDKLLGIFLLAVISLQIFVLSAELQIILMAVGATTLLCATMMALIQRDMKRLLSFCAISQVGYMVLGIGTGNVVGILGGIFHMINHAIYKSDLFLMAGNVEDEAGTADLDRLGGLARRLPATFASAVVATLAIAGVPPLNGFVSKWLVYQGVLTRASDTPGVIVFLVIAVFGSALTLAGLVKVLHSAFLGSVPDGLVLTGRGRSAWRAAPMIVLALLCVGLGLFAASFVNTWLLPALATLPAVDASGLAEIQTTGGALGTDAGWWSPTLGTLLIVVGIVLGLAFYALTNVVKTRVVPTFMGGETLASGQRRFGGNDFYEAIRRLPVLNRIYDDAEHGVFDAYRLSGLSGEGIVNTLRALHCGLLPVYVAWVLYGLLALLLWFLAS